MRKCSWSSARPSRPTEDHHLVVAVFNDRRSAVRLPVRIAAPASHALQGTAILRRIITRPDEQGLAIEEASAGNYGLWTASLEIEHLTPAE